MSCVWDGLNEATLYTEEKKFTLDYVCMDGRGMKKVVGASLLDLGEVIESDHAAIRIERGNWTMEETEKLTKIVSERREMGSVW